jgi:hypothetical protein
LWVGLPETFGSGHCHTSYVIDLDAYRRRKKKQRRRRPSIVRLMRKALEYRRLLDGGEVASQAALAWREGLTRPRVTQILNLLRLPAEVQEAILALPVGTPERLVTERKLRALVGLEREEQVRGFLEMVEGRVHLSSGSSASSESSSQTAVP